MKERIQVIHIDIREDTQIRWDPHTQCIELLDSDGNVSKKHLVSISEGYARDKKGPKILRQLSNPSGSKINLPLKPSVYNGYFAIDTNYRELGNHLLCVTSCVFVDQVNESGQVKKGDVLKFLVPPRLIFLAAKGTKPERYGWMRMIDSFAKSALCDQTLAFGVIVDSDIDDLRKIESSEVDILPGFKMPSNFNLIYASADVGKENMLNKLISAADKISNALLSSIASQIDTSRQFTLTSDFFDVGTHNGKVDFNI